ncbi:phosphoglucomutase/phosphomannomutase PgmG, partial [Curvivirga aplysinae]|uniref:phosphoglucomutase/phosphomannomutase PgmG n=1 Tax=Curvivirga aplysinae TaxID=2529852 RepID=UPI0012BBE1AC
MIVGHRFDRTIMREYDIRGIVGKNLTTADALALGRSLGTIAAGNNGQLAVVGYDGRHSSPILEEELCRGLASSGMYVLRVGLVPSPGLYFASKVLKADVAVMVTGSHNPSEYNGFKMMVENKPFYGEQIQELRELALRGIWREARGGVMDIGAIVSGYVTRMMRDYTSRKGLKIVWDPGNGSAAPSTIALAKLMPGEHYVINDEVDGTFPNHHPDPTVPENLVQLQEAVAEAEADIGIAFDGDGDRIGVVDSQGRILWGDQLLAILSRDVLKNVPGASIIADVKASQMLFDEVARLGGDPVMAPTGHSIIKSEMAKRDAPLAGEMSGHIFFADKYYGYDDALYTAVRLINYLVVSGKSIDELRDELPQVVNTPEIRIDVDESRKFAIVDEIKERLSQTDVDVNDIDGVRVNENGGWWLIRASNTQNALVVRCEAEDESSLETLKGRVKEQFSLSGVN